MTAPGLDGAPSDNTGMAVAVIETQELREVVREELRAHRPEPIEWLNVEGAAKHLATSEDAIRALVKRRAIPSHRTPTGRRLFRPEELDAWVASGDDLRLDV